VTSAAEDPFMSKGLLRAGAIVLAVVASLLTTACSPPLVDMTAVYLDGGHPTAIFHPCRGQHVVDVSVRQGSPLVESWEVSQHPHGDGIGQLRLLEVPPGWELYGSADRRITEFAQGEEYHVEADTDDKGTGNDWGVDFTLADLETLRDGEVWAGHTQPRAMTRDEFFDQHDCGDGWF
jgi:hypothetical protein